ncbi:MAG: hypothetical protein JWM76_1176 [Pseudonocardiales bacterium]|nr:hypothetical protein [Pseudonocardiales bacterium]
MPRLQAVATYLTPWGGKTGRVAGPDEDSITLAVAAGRSVLAGARSALAAVGGSADQADPIDDVVLVTRDLPGLESGTEAVLLAGLGLPRETRCTIVLGGAPSVLSTVSTAAPHTLVLAVDLAPAGAAALIVGAADDARLPELTPLANSAGSLPVTFRNTSGGVFNYEDPRLLRVRGTSAARERLELDDKPVALAGLSVKETSALVTGSPAALPTVGASSTLFALADAIDRTCTGTIIALEQASATAATLTAGTGTVIRTEPDVRALPVTKPGAPANIAISLSAYDRAFDSKLGLQAGRCTTCGTLALPPRLRCLECGSEAPHELTPLPRTGRVYTVVTIHVPVPGMATPYDLAITELGDTGVRLLTPVTGAAAGSVKIDDGGTLVLRRISVRSGVPDYGYSFEPTATEGALR